MTAYGFRIYEMTAHQGRKIPPIDLSSLKVCGVSSSALDELHRHLTSLRGILLVGPANYRLEPFDPDDDSSLSSNVTKKHPYLQITNVERQAERIDVTVEYGREGDYDILLSRDGSPRLELKQKAAARAYRVAFLVPPHGVRAVMVSETRGRSTAGEALMHWLRVRNQHEAVTFAANGDREEAPFVRWSVEPLFDENRIDDILSESSDHAVTFKRLATDAASNPNGGYLRLTQQGIPVSKMADLKATIRKWWDQRKSGDKAAKGVEAAKDLGVLLGRSEVVDKLEFSDGEVSFLEKNKTQTITPNTIERLFVYPLGEDRPSDRDLYKEVVKRLAPMRSDLKLELDLTLSS